MADDDERPRDLRRDQGVVGAEDLDISHDERVASIEPGRYVIATGENRPPAPDELPGETPDSDGDRGESTADASKSAAGEGDAATRADDGGGPEAGGDAGPTGGDDDQSAGSDDDRPELVLPRDPRKRAIVARRLLAERVGAVRADHAFAVTALVDGEVHQHEAVSDEVTDVFRSLVTWYAETVGGETSPDEVLGILLLASEVQVTYPGRAIRALAAAHGLGANDSIGDLVHAVSESGASFPPTRE